jgi:hypothetical protein
MKKVKKKCKLVDERLQVKIATHKSAKDWGEFYVGRQRGKPMCVIEPDEVLSGGRRKSPYYFVTNDKDICALYENRFDIEWESAEEAVDRENKNYKGNYIDCLEDKVKMLKQNFLNPQSEKPATP